MSDLSRRLSPIGLKSAFSMAVSASLWASLTLADEVPCAGPGAIVETEGHRRLALVVGVGEYRDDAIHDLVGPPNDARRIHDLLTAPNGYGFPAENVCLLLNQQATTENFRRAFREHLIANARKDDVVVFYYAGHGSQAQDLNGDEMTDNLDETFLFHDARTGRGESRIGDLRDDELNGLLAALYQKTPHVTVIIDSCNSGTAMRGDAGTMAARFQQADPEPGLENTPDTQGDGAEWVPASMPGMVAFTAASDGTSAVEEDGRGIFTDALLQVLSKVGSKPLTFAEAARQIPPLVAARSYQIPFFQGNLDRPVFGNVSRIRPIGWEVIDVGDSIKLGGAPIPGIGKGAELRVYDRQTQGAATRDPARAKATLAIDEMTGVNAIARIAVKGPDTSGVSAGDLAILVRPADDYVGIKVRLRAPTEGGGIPVDRARNLRNSIELREQLHGLIDLTDDRGEFELALNDKAQMQLLGPENRIRITYLADEAIPDNLWQHARQKALLQIQGEGGAEFSDNQTLEVQIVPSSKQDQCATGDWLQSAPNSDQIIPLCYRWNVKVALNVNSPTSLLVGGVVLSTDGSTFGFPADGRSVLLRPGENVTFKAQGETFKGTPPLDVWDRLLVFGTKPTNPVRWDLLTQIARTRGEESARSGLGRALSGYLRPGTRGQSVDAEVVENSTWTLSQIQIRVEANPRFARPNAGGTALKTREFTLRGFDVRPYLPDDPSTALFRVLAKADWLARASIDDGIGYKQHDWSRPTDALNLKRGIDCSRAVWFAFTRAGLAYSEGNLPIVTANMVTDASPMNAHFERCDEQPLQLGDLIVYRDDKQGDGHVVMVIDPGKRIAWGSQGYDGSARELKLKPDTGVEYQLIKYKRDWARWDRKTMKLKACWRYRNFIAEARTPRGLPGTKALSQACDAERQCGR